MKLVLKSGDSIAIGARHILFGGRDVRYHGWRFTLGADFVRVCDGKEVASLGNWHTAETWEEFASGYANTEAGACPKCRRLLTGRLDSHGRLKAEASP